MKNVLSSFSFHPFLFAAYPVLALLAANLGQVESWVALRPLGAALLVAGVLLLLAYGLTRSWQRAGLAASLLLVLFFSYGHLYDMTRAIQIGAIRPFRLTTLAIVYLALAGVGLFTILQRRASGVGINQVLNLVGVVLVVLSLGQVGLHYARYAALSKGVASQPVEQGSLQVSGVPSRPDVYYIILDSYSRSDVLQNRLGYDNTDFLQSLEDLGFYVAPCARSNYEYTELSMASSLNMEYIQTYGGDFRENGKDRLRLEKLIKDSTVRRLFESAGYRTVSFATGFQWSELRDADVFLEPKAGTDLLRTLTPFEALLLRSTAVRLLTDAPQVRALLAETVQGINFPYEQTVRIERYAFDQLEQAASLASPKFVYAHLMTTHDPVVFDAEGALITDPANYPPPGQDMPPGYFARGVTGEFEYTNKRILKIVGNLIEQSAMPPIIILQGDHGRISPRGPILNAYFFPGGDEELYSNITPVNTFRLIFNRYLGGSFEMLPDITYVLDEETAGSFKERKEEMSACK